MADESPLQLTLNISTLRTRQTQSDYSSGIDDNSTSSKPALRRRSSMFPGKAPSYPGPPREPLRQRRSTKSMSSGLREETSGGSLVAMPAMTDSLGEITYTPTTHRISKAKKGKKVHACEHPGCSKIFTRAEHRKRHEANHNSEPLYQCRIVECRKPFQRSDLLARHMERQHNMSADAFSMRSGRSPCSVSEASFGDSSPARSATFATHLGQPQIVPTQAMSSGTGTMSIGSIIEPDMRSDYGPYPGHNISDASRIAIGPAPLIVPSKLGYGLFASDETPIYSSDSSYSPISDHLQPQIVTQHYYPPDIITRSQSASLETCFQPQQLFSSPLSAPSSAISAMPTWDQFDDVSLGTWNEASYLPNNRQCQYQATPWTSTNGMSYEMNLMPQQSWPWAKVNY